jgi:thiamine pyrophosphokinase
MLGPTCGLLPVGIDSTIISTTGLRWNLSANIPRHAVAFWSSSLLWFKANNESSFDGLVSTSNHLVPEEETVWIKTSKPIWWSVELKKMT